MADYRWLNTQHSIYTSWRSTWEKNERRLAGGDDVLDELLPFEYEDPNGPSLAGRKAWASYPDWPANFADIMVGHLTRQGPRPEAGLSFGALGQVRRERDVSNPTQAELVYYNVDGVGNDGSLWDNWWGSVMRRAMSTGHRWLFCEGAPERPSSQRDEQLGLRPYLVEFSPVSVPFWHFERGRLQIAIVRVPSTRVEFDPSGLKPSEGDDFLLLVRRGVTLLGSEFRGGGWWLFDANTRPLGRSGTWDATDGEIPMWIHYYRRDTGHPKRAAISRPGLTELGQAAVAYMNLDSAADYDTWEAAASIMHVLGVHREAFNLADEKRKDGARWIPWLADAGTGQAPTIFDGSTGAVSADVFKARLEAKIEHAKQLASREATSTPDSSGRSKEAGFGETKAPRLSLMASEMEASQNTAIYFLERRFGHARPSGSASWPRKFDLAPVLDEIRDLFELENISGLRSATLGAKAMTMAAKEKGLAADDTELQTIENEYKQSAQERAAARAQKLAEDADIVDALNG